MERTTVHRREPTVDETHVVPASAAETARTDDLGWRDQIRWGPIVGGLVTGIATLMLLTVLGLAIGLSAFDPGDEGIGTAAAIWGGISTLIAFFIGGLVAARTAGVWETGMGALNGFLVGALAIVVMLWLTGSGLGNLLGAAGANFGEIQQIGTPNIDGQQAFDQARDSAWGTFIGLALALGAATIGGLVGQRARGDDGDRARR